MRSKLNKKATYVGILHKILTQVAFLVDDYELRDNAVFHRTGLRIRTTLYELGAIFAPLPYVHCE